MARLNLPPLKAAESDGFLRQSTYSYLLYAFVPSSIFLDF